MPDVRGGLGCALLSLVMKVSTLLSLAALLTTFSAVACSSSATPAGTSKSNSSSAGDDDDDKSTSGKPSTTTSTSKTDEASADPDMTAAQKACQTCMVKDSKYKALVDCANAAKDEAAAEKCFTDAGCTDENAESSVCAKAHDACATECKAADDEAEAAGAQAGEKCLTCVSGNAQAKAVETCYQAAKSQADADKCDDLDKKCFANASCKAAYDKCADECQ